MSRRKPKRRKWDRQEKADLVEKFHQSGLSQLDFSRQIGVHSSLFWKWIRLARNGELPRPSPSISTLVAVRVKSEDEKPAPAPIELVLSGGRILRAPRGFDADHLRRLIEVLEGC